MNYLKAALTSSTRLICFCIIPCDTFKKSSLDNEPSQSHPASHTTRKKVKPWVFAVLPTISMPIWKLYSKSQIWQHWTRIIISCLFTIFLPIFRISSSVGFCPSVLSMYPISLQGIDSKPWKNTVNEPLEKFEVITTTNSMLLYLCVWITLWKMTLGFGSPHLLEKRSKKMTNSH